MRAFALAPEVVTEDRVVGTILCSDVTAAGSAGRVRINKGTVLLPVHVEVLRAYSEEIHVLALDQGDVHEDEAAVRLAAAISGPGVESTPPVESMVHVRAVRRGYLEINADALRLLNELPDISVFTRYDGQPVKEGSAVAAAKVTPLAISGDVLARAEEAAAGASVVSVRPFLGGSVGVVVRDRLSGKAREKFEAALHMKVEWFGSSVAAVRYVPDDVAAIAACVDDLVNAGVILVLAAGVNSTDPLDLTIQALERLGATHERRGVPAHPGSTCWLSALGDVPVFGLALCGMFSRTTVLDLLLPRFLSGRPVTDADLASLGHGGLLGKEMSFRFPAYGDQ